jgi:hypothetical protein
MFMLLSSVPAPGAKGWVCLSAVVSRGCLDGCGSKLDDPFPRQRGKMALTVV